VITTRGLIRHPAWIVDRAIGPGRPLTILQ
jgi:hypothetical protein